MAELENPTITAGFKYYFFGCTTAVGLYLSQWLTSKILLWIIFGNANHPTKMPINKNTIPVTVSVVGAPISGVGRVFFFFLHKTIRCLSPTKVPHQCPQPAPPWQLHESLLPYTPNGRPKVRKVDVSCDHVTIYT